MILFNICHGYNITMCIYRFFVINCIPSYGIYIHISILLQIVPNSPQYSTPVWQSAKYISTLYIANFLKRYSGVLYASDKVANFRPLSQDEYKQMTSNLSRNPITAGMVDCLNVYNNQPNPNSKLLLLLKKSYRMLSCPEPITQMLRKPATTVLRSILVYNAPFTNAIQHELSILCPVIGALIEICLSTNNGVIPNPIKKMVR
jgi:hypothetical protein